MLDRVRLTGAALVFTLAWITGCAGGSNSTETTSGNGGSIATSSTGTTLTGTSSSSSHAATTSAVSSTSAASTTSAASSSSSGTATGGASGTGGSGAGGAGTGGAGTGGSIPTGKPLGADCTMDSDCQSQLCKPVVIDSNSVCVTPCTQQSDCGLGTTYFCEAVTEGSANGYCIPHSPAHCLSCATDSDCGSLSEVCFQAPGDSAKACNIDCALAGDSACPPDYACTPETVGGQPRQLCRPKGYPSCLDAVGGYCDRLAIPQACVRLNSAGTCVGSRTCMPGSQRFSACGAVAPQCKTDCTIQDPAGCMEIYCPGATDTVTNCGACGKVCPGYMKPNSDASCQNGTTCAFTCEGEHYDVNDDPTDGCEVADAPTGNHTQSTPAYVGDVSCDDGNGHTVHFTGTLPSDTRVHANPAVTGFDSPSGSAPDWYYINATGGLTCVDDVVLNFTPSGTIHAACYGIKVITDKNTYSCSGGCAINHSSGQYSDGSVILIEITKSCSTSTITETMSWTVDGHL